MFSSHAQLRSTSFLSSVCSGTHVHTNNIIYNIYIYIRISMILSITASTITNFYVCKFLQIIIYRRNHHFFVLFLSSQQDYNL